MNNFGVIEVASAKTTNAPGWAYVPDTAASSVPSQSVSAVHLHVNRNKRAARQANNNGGGSAAQLHNDVSARHDAKLQKEIEQLQRDSFGGGFGGSGGRDHAAQVAVPGGGGRDKDGKIRGHTPNVRKILASQKTFANHLDDFDAWRKTQAEGGGAVGSAGQSAVGTPAPQAVAVAGAGNKRAAAGGGGPAQKKGGGGGGGASSSRARTAAASSNKNSKKAATPAPAADPDVSMTDAPPSGAEDAHPEATTATTSAPAPAEKPDSEVLAPFTRFTPTPHPGDADPLLETWLPPLPADDELRELVGAPALSYHQAKGRWTDDDRRYPARSFCGVCGYWGRVRCIKCGTRVCALDCLDVHREECITRYGL